MAQTLSIRFEPLCFHKQELGVKKQPENSLALRVFALFLGVIAVIVGIAAMSQIGPIGSGALIIGGILLIASSCIKCVKHTKSQNRETRSEISSPPQKSNKKSPKKLKTAVPSIRNSNQPTLQPPSSSSQSTQRQTLPASSNISGSASPPPVTSTTTSTQTPSPTERNFKELLTLGASPRDKLNIDQLCDPLTPKSKKAFEEIFADLEQALLVAPKGKYTSRYFTLNQTAPHVATFQATDILVHTTLFLQPDLPERRGWNRGRIMKMLAGYVLKYHPDKVIGFGACRMDNSLFIYFQGIYSDPFDDEHFPHEAQWGQPIEIRAPGQDMELTANGLKPI